MLSPPDTSLTTLLAQFQGHPAAPYLLKRQQLVNDFMGKYPDYFLELASLSEWLIQKDKLSEDQRQQILYGNTGLVLKLEALYQEDADSTAAARHYHGIKKVLTTAEKAKGGLERELIAFIKLAETDYLESHPGANPESFSLETFSWSEKAQEGLSKKQRRTNCPQAKLKIRDVVIPKKLQDISDKTRELLEASPAYHATSEYQRLSEYLRLKAYPPAQEMYQATQKANQKLCSGDSSDGGFEQDILGPHFKAQWYPKLEKTLRDRLMEEEMSPEDIDPFILSLDVCPNLYYVVKYSDPPVGKETNAKRRTWYSAAEQDLIVYHRMTMRVMAVIEVKRNPNDDGGADLQHRRDWVMISGIPDPSDPGGNLFGEYHDKPAICDRYVADRNKIATAIFKTVDYAVKPISCIITSDLSEMERHGRLQVPSKVVTQITHWLYSSQQTPAHYIQEKIDELINNLHYRSVEEIDQERQVFRLKI
jgi:hypothetical protein